MAQTFHRSVVTSVSLSCLLSMDYVPGCKPPPVAEMVSIELPRVLSVITRKQHLGGVEVELRQGVCADPAGLLKRVTDAVKDLTEASTLVLDHGHEDMVFSALQYTRKPPTATCARIKNISKEVASILQVDIPDNFDEFLGDVYDTTHGMLTRV